MNLDLDVNQISKVMKFEIAEIAKSLIIPAICLITSLVLYVIFISPYSFIQETFGSSKEALESDISILRKNREILVQTREQIEPLKKASEQLTKFVSPNPNPALVSGILQDFASRTNFTLIEENRNVEVDPALAQNIIEVRFNGRTIGVTSAVNFLNLINSTKDSLYAIRNLEIFKNQDEDFTRVSFLTQTIYDSSTVKLDPLSPIPNILEREDFKKFRESLESK